MGLFNESEFPLRRPRRRHCAYCLIPILGSEIKLCGKCGRRAYCSRQCQTLDWSHQREDEGEVNANKGQRGQGHKDWCGLNCGEEDLDWGVIPVEGKGLGLVALKPIPARSRILVEAAQFSPYAHPATKELSSVGGPVGVAVDKGKDKPGDLIDLDEIWLINAFGAGDGQDSDVLCLRIARANHSCDPNAGHIYCNVFKVKILFAERDIAPGEEICINYQPFKTPSELEQRRIADKSSRSGVGATPLLKSTWGISCPLDCHCNNPRILKDLQKGIDLDKSMFHLSRTGKVEEAMEQVKELLALQEGRLRSSYKTKAMMTLHSGFFIGITTKKTMSQGMDCINKMLEIMGDILHPKSALIQEWEGFKRDPASIPTYLLYDQDQ